MSEFKLSVIGKLLTFSQHFVFIPPHWTGLEFSANSHAMECSEQRVKAANRTVNYLLLLHSYSLSTPDFSTHFPQNS